MLVTRTAQGTGPVPVTVTGPGCHVTGLPEGVPQRFEVVAVYRGPGGTELTSKPEQLTVIPRGEAKPNDTLQVTTTESDGRIRVRLTWRRIDNSEVAILRTAPSQPWPTGSLVDLAAGGTGRAAAHRPGRSQGAECDLETELPGGIHYLTPLSEGATGVVVGKSQSVAVIYPVRNLVATPFADYATVSWEWPETVQLAEVSWKAQGDDEDSWDFGAQPG